MGTGYTRNDTANNIADGNVINASDLDGEFDAVQAAFNGTTGHSHDGTSGEGPQIATAGLADNAVTTAKITDANVTTAKIADSNVTTAKITDANVTLAKMAANSVDSDQYVDGSIDRIHLAADIIDGTKIADNAVDSEHYTDGSIDRVHLAADIVDGTKIADDSIDSEHYVDGSIDTAHIANDAVTGDKLANNIQIAGTLGVTGETTLTTHLNMGDNDIIKLGADADLRIYHNGTHSYVSDQGTGNLLIGGSTSVRIQNSDHTQNMAVFTAGAEAALYYSNATKLATTSTGVSVTGNVVVSGTVDGRDVASDGSKLDGIESGATADQTASEILTLIKTVDGSGSGLDADTLDGLSSASFLRSAAEDTKTSGALNFSDNVVARFGTGNDLQIYHDGSNSYIIDQGTGDLRIRATQLHIEDSGGNDYIVCTDTGTGGTVELKQNAVTKLNTTSDGVDITGELQADSLDIDGAADISGQVNFHSNVVWDDNNKLIIGNGSDGYIYSDGTNLIVEGQNADSEVRLLSDDRVIIGSKAFGESFAIFNDDGAVDLYFDGNIKISTASDGITVTGNINGATDIFVEDQIIHTGDTDTYIQFHAANEWRVVTGGTEMLEVNDNYILLGANSVGKVQTTNVASSLSPNMYLFNSFVLTLTGNINLTNPTTEVTGMSGVFIIIQDGTGGRTVSLGTDYETVGGAGLTLSTAPNAVDIIPFYVQSSGNVLLGTPQLAFS